MDEFQKRLAEGARRAGIIAQYKYDMIKSRLSPYAELEERRGREIYEENRNELLDFKELVESHPGRLKIEEKVFEDLGELCDISLTQCLDPSGNPTNVYRYSQLITLQEQSREETPMTRQHGFYEISPGYVDEFVRKHVKEWRDLLWPLSILLEQDGDVKFLHSVTNFYIMGGGIQNWKPEIDANSLEEAEGMIGKESVEKILEACE